MEAKDKAEELVNKMHKSNWKMTSYSAVSCAIICVDELTKENLTMDNESISDVEMVERLNQRYSFWKEVKSELEKMK